MSKVELQNISYAYDEVGGISDVSFVAHPGEILAIVGASGSGKSTLLKIIAGFLQPASGEMWLDGELVASSKVNKPPKSRSIGLVFQNHALLPHKTIKANVEFGCKTKSEYAFVENILRELRIEQLANKFPHEVSGGQSQRASLARAIAARSKILLMDEPFSSLDSHLRRELRNDMLRFLRDKSRTTILVTHDAEEALEIADRILVLDHGHVVQYGSPQEIYFSPEHLEVAQLFGEINHVQGAKLISTLTGEKREEALIRPECFEVSNEGSVEGRLIHVAYRGNHFVGTVMLPGERCLKVKMLHEIPDIGAKVKVKYTANL